MKTVKVVPQKKEEKEPALSTDELIALLKRHSDQCQNFAQGLSLDTIAPIMFLAKSLDADDGAEPLFMEIHGRRIEYCHPGNGAGRILEWISSTIHEYVEKIDRSHMDAGHAIDRYKDAHPKAASSRLGRSPGGAA